MKISTPFIFDILLSFNTLSKAIFWPNIPVKNYRVPRYPSLTNTTVFLICNALASAPATEKDTEKYKYKYKKTNKLKALILVLCLLLVVGTVKIWSDGTNECKCCTATKYNIAKVKMKKIETRKNRIQRLEIYMENRGE